MNDIGYLGIDVGSISTNIVVIEPGGEVLFTLYARGGGDPIRSVQKGLQGIREELSENFRIAGVCTSFIRMRVPYSRSVARTARSRSYGMASSSISP
jgi:activator of 2-hydroxyglutaryl-CoA dehydratase